MATASTPDGIPGMTPDKNYFVFDCALDGKFVRAAAMTAFFTTAQKAATIAGYHITAAVCLELFLPMTTTFLAVRTEELWRGSELTSLELLARGIGMVAITLLANSVGSPIAFPLGMSAFTFLQLSGEKAEN